MTADVSETESTNNYDPRYPKKLLDFVLESWGPAQPQISAPHRVAEHTVKRRQRLVEEFPGEWLVVPTGKAKARANDTDYLFRPDSGFYWLTGSTESDQVLVIDASGEATLFVPPRADTSTSRFITDRRYGEAWVGPRLGLEETALLLGIKTAPLPEVESVLSAIPAGRVRVLRGVDPQIDAVITGDEEMDSAFAVTLSELRLIKDAYEVARLREACESSARGFEDVVRELASAKQTSERWVEGTFYRRARTEGNDTGYHSICAAGEHGTTLHYWRNDGTVRDGDLLLLDAGVEHVELYTADITRTMPISGKFTEPQLEIYNLVLAAQEAAIAVTRPGAKYSDPNTAAMEVLARGLFDLGILPVTPEESLEKESGLHRRWTLHGVSHMLGIDVHDCAKARAELYTEGELKEGHVFTIEPGLYFRTNDELVPERFRGIGIRIEDDFVVTADGCENLSAMLPRSAEEVEAWMSACIR